MLNGKEISWDEARDVVSEKLAAAGSKVAVISGDQSGTVNEVFSALLADKGSDAFYSMPCDMQAADKAWTGLMGGSGQIGYDLENADMVLLAGADALESWGPTVANMKAFAANESGKFVFAGPMQTKTASVNIQVGARPGRRHGCLHPGYLLLCVAGRQVRARSRL